MIAGLASRLERSGGNGTGRRPHESIRWTRRAGGVAIVLLSIALTRAEGAIHYVDDNATAGGDGVAWATAFSTLQAALAAALPGDTVRVAQGTYAPDRGGSATLGDPSSTFAIPDGVTIEGGYVGLTGGDPNVRNVSLYPTTLDGTLQAIHVAPTGADTIDCGLFPSSPCATIEYAITRADAIGCKAILVRAGTYAETIELTGTSGLLIQGGFDAAWQFGPYDDPAHEVRIAGGLAASLDQYLALNLDSTTSCTLADLVIEAPDAVGSVAAVARSSYGIRVVNSTGLRVERVTILGGAGASGAAGANGTQGWFGNAQGGSSGDGGWEDGAVSCDGVDPSGGSGGFNSSAGIGGNGGSGGSADSDCTFPFDYGAETGVSGGGGSSGGSPFGGSGGSSGSVCGSGGSGFSGSAGLLGSGGGAGPASGTQAGGLWVPTAGGDGGLGTHGGGGGGGGGAGGCDSGGSDCAGPGGGGGGAGGLRASAAGQGGRGGGWSFGLFSVASSVSVIDCELVGGAGGAGGVGGQGALGQTGGSGGSSGSSPGSCTSAGSGGSGGTGGHSGCGGGGAGGSVRGIHWSGGSVSVAGTVFSGGVAGPGGAGGTLPGPSIDGLPGVSGSVAAYSGAPSGGDAARPQEPWNHARTIVTSSGDSTLDGVTIRGARNYTSPGGGVQITGGSLDLHDATIEDNTSVSSGGGIFISAGVLDLERSIVRDNSATSGAGLFASSPSSSVELASSLFHGNIATSGGGAVQVTGSTLTANGATIAENEAATGGGILVTSGSAAIYNSIFWGNTAPSGPQFSVSSGSLVVSSSDVEGSWPGAGNIDADPQFLDASGGDFHLALTSPCIHLGNNGAPGGSALDIDGEPRVQCVTLDLGADETPHCPAVPGVTSLTCFPSGPIVQLFWNLGGAYSAIEVYRDSVLLATLVGNATSYNDFSPTVGSNAYQVIAYDSGAPSPTAGCTVAIAPLGVSGVLCSISDLCACEAELTWANSAAYDLVRILADGVEIAALPGSSTSATVILPSADPTQLCVRGEVEGVPGADGCCSVDCDPPAVLGVASLACDVDVGACTASLTWSLGSSYSLLRLLVDGVEVQILSGGATSAFIGLPGAGDYELCVTGETICGDPVPSACCTASCGVAFIRGDANNDLAFNIADPIASLAFLFSGGSLACVNAADSNDDESLNIADAVSSLASLFSGGLPPPAPHPSCGADPTPGGLTCNSPACP